MRPWLGCTILILVMIGPGAWAAGARSSGVFGQLDLSRQSSDLSLSTASSHFDGWGWGAEAGLDMGFGSGWTLTLSAAAEEKELFNSYTTSTFSERSKVFSYGPRVALSYKFLGLGGGYKMGNLKVTAVTGKPQGYEVSSTGSGAEAFLAGTFELDKSIRSTIEINYQQGKFEDLQYKDLSLHLKFGFSFGF